MLIKKMVCGIMTMIFTLNIAMVSVSAVSEDSGIATQGAVVRYWNNEVTTYEESTDVDMFIEMLQQEESAISPFAIPDPEPGTTRISEVVRSVQTRADYERIIKNALSKVTTYVWARFGGKIVYAISPLLFANEGFWSSAVTYGINRAIDRAGSLGFMANGRGADFYSYKIWSEYYGVYMIKNVMITYNNSSCTQVDSVDVWNVAYEGKEAALR